MFATIYLPNFYLQAAMRHQPDLRAQPVAVIEKQENKLVIIQLNHAAESAGIRKRMTPSQALARSLSVAIRTRERAQEKTINEILIQHAFTLSPFVEATGPGVCTIQFGRQPCWLSGETGFQSANRTGPAGSLSSKLARVIEQLGACEIIAQAGIASLPDASFLAAHLARPVLKIDDAKEFFAPLPIDTLAMTLGT
jgi:nucleotidyltransferase/DNA polymerase involved in DNA repair